MLATDKTVRNKTDRARPEKSSPQPEVMNRQTDTHTPAMLLIKRVCLKMVRIYRLVLNHIKMESHVKGPCDQVKLVYFDLPRNQERGNSHLGAGQFQLA